MNWTYLNELHKPKFGQISLWILLGTSAYVVLETHLQYQYLPKGDNLSVLGYILPQSFWDNALILNLGKSVFFPAALIWAGLPFLVRLNKEGEEKNLVQLAVLAKLAALLCVLSYFYISCVYWENLPWVRHKFILPFWLLTLNALWYQFYASDIVQALKEGQFCEKEIYPGWVYGASIFFIAVFYTFSGISKILSVPDFNWANGVSLQLWTYAFGDANSPVAKLILSDRFYAKILQTGVLLLESLCFLSVFFTPVRLMIGLGLVLFHCAVDLTFSIKIPFESQKILLLLYFMPWFSLHRRKEEQKQS